MFKAKLLFLLRTTFYTSMIFITYTSIVVTGSSMSFVIELKTPSKIHNSLEELGCVFYNFTIYFCVQQSLFGNGFGSQVSKFGFFLILIRPPEHRHEL
jgi:hypothetical protein